MAAQSVVIRGGTAESCLPRVRWWYRSGRGGTNRRGAFLKIALVRQVEVVYRGKAIRVGVGNGLEEIGDKLVRLRRAAGVGLCPFRQDGAKARRTAWGKLRLMGQSGRKRRPEALFRQKRRGGMQDCFMRGTKSIGPACAHVFSPLHMKGCYEKNQKKGGLFKHCVPFQ